MNLDLLRLDLIRDEGRKTKPYKDSVGVLTIGVGWNLEEHGLPDTMIEELLERSIADAVMDLNRTLPWWTTKPEPIQRGMVNMVFNLGIGRFLKFEKTIAALGVGDYETAAVEALDSRWARQVGDRAHRIAVLFRSVAV